MSENGRPAHGMLPGSHEQMSGPECRCGYDWDRWTNRCVSEPAR